MGAKAGLDAKTYYKVGGQAGGGAWTELTNLRDLTLGLETGEADSTTRANAGWKSSIATLKEGSVEFEMVWDTADAGFAALKDAFFNNTNIGLRVLDGPAPGGKGLQADFVVTKFERQEPLEEVIKVAVTLKVAYSATPPSWITA